MSEFDQTPQPEGRLNGAKPPLWPLGKEQLWHRAAASIFACGVCVRDVARQLGKSETTLQNLTRQPWFQEEVSRLMREQGRDMNALFAAEQINSLQTLVKLRDDRNTPAAARIQCARDILDRALGKPVQRVETSGIPVSDDPVAEAEALTLEINRLRRETSPPPIP